MSLHASRAAVSSEIAARQSREAHVVRRSREPHESGRAGPGRLRSRFGCRRSRVRSDVTLYHVPMQRSLTLFALLTMTAGAAVAQAPHEDWRTVTTPSFRVHYPAPWEEWSLRAASRLESARTRVAAAVGYNPEERIDVLIMDPAATANASALPILGRPRIVLWTTPPDPAGPIGDSRDWQEQLIVHETAHILHINRPSRNRFDSLIEQLLPIGPIARAPRWVTEGYATVIEGDLTGSGRPFRDFRAAVLRSWAETGRLPTYDQMASDSRSFMGMSMAYLAGSAYLEWLRDRTAPESLQHLWRRMTAREDRSFEQAFRGVFGDSPQNLYALFRAELTQKSLNLREDIAPSLREGTLILDLSRRAGPIDVNADGSRLVGVVRARNQPARLVVWDTAVDEEAVEKRAEQLRRILERDPEDVPPVDPPTLPRERLHDHALPSGADVGSVAFLPDARIIFTSSHPDDDGVLHSELHIWDPERGSVERITRRGDVFSAAPDPDGSSVVAIRHRHGKSALVRIALGSGAAEQLTTAALEPALAGTAVAPNGRISFIERSGASWGVAVADPNGNVLRRYPAPPDAMLADLEWEQDGSLLATLGRAGFLEVARLNPDTGVWNDLTRTTRAAWSAAAGGGSIYFLWLDPEGLDVRSIPANAEGFDPAERISDERYAPVVRRRFRGESPPLLESAPLEPPHPYGLGPREIDSVFGGYSSSDARLFEGGLRLGDPIGRFETLLVGGWSNSDERGALADLRWRGTTAPLSATAWSWRRSAISPDFTGVSLGAERTWRAIDRRLNLNGAIGWQEMEHSNFSRSGAGAFLEAGSALRREFGRMRVDSSIGGRAEWMDAEDTERVRARARIGGRLSGLALSYMDSVGVSSGSDGFRIGGLASTILPPFQRGAFVESPAVAPLRLVGEDFRHQRMAMTLPVLPGEFFLERLTASRASAADQKLDLVGWNVRLAVAAIPLIGLPSLNLELGVAHELDEPRARDLTWWIGTRWSLD